MLINRYQQNYFMQLAIDQAKLALQINEIPVGAVIIDGENRVIAQAHNLTSSNVCNHAEMLVLQQALKQDLQLNNRLVNCSIYVTLEPCIMCFGAILLTRISNIFFGAYDDKFGAITNGINLDKMAHSIPNIYGGIAEAEARKLLQQFFLTKRQ
jgi:tRNA(adenine34) deaminase